LIDRLGIRSTFAWAFLTWSLASAAMAFSHKPHHFLLLRIVLGLAEAAGPVASLAVIRRQFTSREQGLPVSIYLSGQTLGPACGALLGSALLARFGWRPMFIAIGLGALIWLLPWLYFTRGCALQTRVSSSASHQNKMPWRVMWLSPAFGMLSFCAFLFAYYWYFLLSWMPGYLSRAVRPEEGGQQCPHDAG
jgi:MFS family permease